MVVATGAMTPLAGNVAIRRFYWPTDLAISPDGSSPPQEQEPEGQQVSRGLDR